MKCLNEFGRSQLMQFLYCYKWIMHQWRNDSHAILLLYASQNADIDSAIRSLTHCLTLTVSEVTEGSVSISHTYIFYPPLTKLKMSYWNGIVCPSNCPLQYFCIGLFQFIELGSIICIFIWESGTPNFINIRPCI